MLKEESNIKLNSYMNKYMFKKKQKRNSNEYWCLLFFAIILVLTS